MTEHNDSFRKMHVPVRGSKSNTIERRKREDRRNEIRMKDKCKISEIRERKGKSD